MTFPQPPKPGTSLLLPAVLVMVAIFPTPSSPCVGVQGEREEGAEALATLTRLVEWGTKAGKFLGEDGRGRPFVLDSEDLTVFPLSSSGLGDPAAKLSLSQHEPGRYRATHAAMGPSPDDWILRELGGKLRVFKSGRQTEVPAMANAATDVGWGDAGPVVWVNSYLIEGKGTESLVGTQAEEDSRGGAHSLWRLQLSPAKWRGVYREERPAIAVRDVDGGENQGLGPPYGEEVGLIATDSGYYAWHNNIYRMDLLSTRGSLEETLTSGVQEVRLVEKNAEHLAQMRERFPNIIPSRPSRAIAALTEDDRGRVLVVVSKEYARRFPDLADELDLDGATHVLDRYDPYGFRVDRLAIRLPGWIQSTPFWMTAAYTSEGLFLQDFRDGLWFIEATALDGSPWTDVSSLFERNGIAMETSAE